MQHVWLFLAGALLCNSVPHLCAGLQGHPFPTPFARPRGVGDSSPVVNILWGFANLAVGLVVTAHQWDTAEIGPHAAAMLLGALAIGMYLAIHFGKVQRDKRAR
jgi:hypothetical protein